jgi:cobalt-zinc-cadmium efflux system outer membrane protein
MRSEAQALSQAVDRQHTEAELRIARRQLALSWGDREATFDSLASNSLSSPESTRRVFSHPVLDRAAANEALAGSRKRAAEAARVPDITLLGGLRRLEEVRGTGFVMALELPLPLWNRSHGALLAAQQEYEAALADGRATSQQLEVEWTNAVDRLRSATATYDALRLRVRPAREQLIDDLLRAYRAGRLSYLDLVAEQRNLLETDLAVVEAEADLWRSRMALEFLVGVEPRPEEGR